VTSVVAPCTGAACTGQNPVHGRELAIEVDDARKQPGVAAGKIGVLIGPVRQRCGSDGRGAGASRDVVALRQTGQSLGVEDPPDVLRGDRGALRKRSAVPWRRSLPRLMRTCSVTVRANRTVTVLF
jgi:hypothetical protein